ncbi:MAG: hypothetical protein ABI895_09640 [Deltaproteobacteria bacterium]
MKHRSICVALCLGAGCTYNTYKTYNEAPSSAGDDDAGVHEPVGAVGATSAGGAGGGAGTTGQGGSALGEAGSSALSGSDCSGCVRLSVLSGRSVEYQLEFDSRQNLASSLVRARVRVRDYVGDVQLVMYIESGDHVDLQQGPQQGNSSEGVASFVTLNAAAGWQDVGIDLQPVEAFRPPSFADAGGTAGASFDAGNPFDKTRVERVGLQVTPLGQFGVFTPATLELDALTFAPQENLNVGFSTDPGGFELVDPESGTASFVAE